jgi:hypothetical protein
LLDRGRIFQLKLDITVGNKRLDEFEASKPVLIKAGDDMYFLQSSRDVAFVGWMQHFGKQLTIFRHDIDDFEREVLGQLRNYYTVVLEKAPPLPMAEKNQDLSGIFLPKPI